MHDIGQAWSSTEVNVTHLKAGILCISSLLNAKAESAVICTGRAGEIAPHLTIILG